MNKYFSFAVLLILFTSCLTEQPGFVLTAPPETPEEIRALRAFDITDHKNRNTGLDIPEWANRFFEGGIRAVRVMEANMNSYMFIARSEGNNFNALNLWNDGFNAELDFPRLAAARIDARFSAGVHFPDTEYGAFYETLIRAVSDFRWTGMVKEDDFWIQRSFSSNEDEPAREDWEFLILVTIEKTHFASQLNLIFQNINPDPPPTETQALAARRVIDRFFQGF